MEELFFLETYTYFDPRNSYTKASLIDLQHDSETVKKKYLNIVDVGGQAHACPDHAGIKLAITDEV